MVKNKIMESGAYSQGYETKIYNVRKMILNRMNKAGLVKVYIEISDYEYHSIKNYKKSQTRISTDVWINPKNWNKKKQEISTDEPEYYKKNYLINKVYNEVKSAIDEATRPDPSPYISPFAPKWLISLFPHLKTSKKSLVNYVEDYWEFRKNQNTIYGTLKEFKTLKNRIAAFDEWNNSTTCMEDINLSWSNNFEIFLRNFANNKKGYAEGTIEKTYTLLITVLNYYWDIKDELNTGVNDKFKNKRFKRGKKSSNMPNPLTFKQLEVLYKHDFKNNSLNKIKDRFTLQCYSGMRFSDIDKIKPDNIKNNTMFVYKPQKTSRYNKIVVQPLNNRLNEILKKYNYDTSSLKISNQKYNEILVHMFKILKNEYPDLGYKDKYTTHNGRDTFISLAVARGVDYKTILEWTGQSSYKIMDRYIGLSSDFKNNQMEKLFGTVA